MLIWIQISHTQQFPQRPIQFKDWNDSMAAFCWSEFLSHYSQHAVSPQSNYLLQTLVRPQGLEWLQVGDDDGPGPSGSKLRKSGNMGYIDGLMQKRRNSSALALELRLFCIKPWKSGLMDRHNCSASVLELRLLHEAIDRWISANFSKRDITSVC